MDGEQHFINIMLKTKCINGELFQILMQK